ncbi:hypothetical protein EVAR_97575_1 [Eumeta japonica]|uniref:Uncharacterized protein n=1 Tax=Eumeta variegata TaxID=151549 RepID=A0A4C1WNX3_EUMVA|nr:hypothetical protein EVAR_97575_1 [Eumeta japonica]
MCTVRKMDYERGSSGCSAFAIGRRRSSPRDHPFSLVCYCVSVFLRAALRSVGLRACMSVGGAAQWTSRGDSKATFVPVIYSGYRTVCTPSPRTVSMPRERFRKFTLQITIAILVISFIVIFNPEGFNDLRAVGTPVPSARRLRRLRLSSLRAKKAGALTFQESFSPCESDTPRAPGYTDCP